MTVEEIKQLDPKLDQFLFSCVFTQTFRFVGWLLLGVTD